MPSSGVQTCARSEEHTSELQSHDNLVCRLLLEKTRRQQLSRSLPLSPGKAKQLSVLTARWLQLLRVSPERGCLHLRAYLARAPPRGVGAFPHRPRLRI